MKRIILVILLVLFASGLFAEVEAIYQKQHKNINSIDVVTLAKQEENWYFISIIIAENNDAIDKYMIYDESLERLQDLLFQFEKEKEYKERIKAMEKAETLLFLEEKTSIQDNHIIKTKHYLYVK